MKLRVFLPFAAGLAAGVALTALLITGPRSVKAAPAHLAASFADISSSSPAAGAVNRLCAEGILVATPDKKFHGDQPVTRYEMAVVLDRFVHYLEQGRKPLHNTSVPVRNSQVSAPVGHWAHNSQIELVKGRFLLANSPILQPPGNKPVTATEFSDVISTTVSRVAERALPPTPNADDPDTGNVQ